MSESVKDAPRGVKEEGSADVFATVIINGIPVKLDYQPIETVPRDGRLVMLMDPDVGCFPMRWSPLARNPLFQPGRGIWVMSDGSMTWSEHGGLGPTKWAPYPDDPTPSAP